MSFRSFGGEFSRGTRVSLAGKSKTAEASRDQVLDQVKRQREERKQAKLENKCATTIQAAWRSYSVREKAKACIRQEWMQIYQSNGQNLSSNDLLNPTSPYLRQLCFFAKPTNQEDVALIATACQLASSLVTAGIDGSTCPALCAAAAAPSDMQIIRLRACKLTLLALDCLIAHLATFTDALSHPKSSTSNSSFLSSQQLLVAVLVETITTFISPASWKTALGPSEGTEAAAQTLHYIMQRKAFRKLTQIVFNTTTSQTSLVSTCSLSEGLCTAMVVRYFSLPSKYKQRESSSQYGPALLMTVPLLIKRLPSLAPVAGRLWRDAIQDIAPIVSNTAELISWLPTSSLKHEADLDTGKSLAAAALLGNLIDNAELALKPALSPPTTSPSVVDSGVVLLRSLGMHFVQVATRLLAILPIEVFFPGQRNVAWMGDDDSSDDEEESSGTIHTDRATRMHGVAIVQQQQDGGKYNQQQNKGKMKHLERRLAWDKEELVPTELVSQLQKLTADPSVLKACVRAVLPAADAASAPVSVVDAASPARAICSFVSTVLRLPGHATPLLAVSAGLPERLWFSYLRGAHASGDGAAWAAVSSTENASVDPGWMLPVSLFSEGFSMSLAVAGDEGLYEKQHPLPLTELYSPTAPRGVISLLKFALWHALWTEAPPSPGGWSSAASSLRTRLCRAAGRLLGQLHSRNGRRQFAPPEAFHAESLPVERFRAEAAAGAAAGRDSEDPGASRAWSVLAHAPCLLPFQERARVFQSLVSNERAQHRDEDLEFFHGFPTSRQFITVRRGQVLSDAFNALSTGPGADSLKGRVRIRYVSEQGLEEAGVDGGGIFKEFLGDLVKEGFDPAVGLFKATTDNRLYPNPRAPATAPGALRAIEFLGKIVGKAMWEGILIELPLAYFFLKKFRGAVCDVDDLPTLDPELHRHLLSLKSYQGDVVDLGLTFTITTEVAPGKTAEIELVPGGSDIPVTSVNAVAYIRRVADFRLNVQLRETSAAFLKGLHSLIPPHWVSMFNERELQELIAGAEGGSGLDLRDLKANVQYSGGYHEEHPVILALWEALAGLTPSQQGEFLRFVTSCSRPPLLGFRYLEPPLCVQLAGSTLDPTATDRLPTASTCMNLLKLPPYRSAAEIQRKLLYAIEAGAGFELS